MVPSVIILTAGQSVNASNLCALTRAHAAAYVLGSPDPVVVPSGNRIHFDHSNIRSPFPGFSAVLAASPSVQSSGMYSFLQFHAPLTIRQLSLCLSESTCFLQSLFSAIIGDENSKVKKTDYFSGLP